MATKAVQYISYPQAVRIHIELMRALGEIRYGVSDRTLIESALARAPQAAAYENADVLRQAATMFYGLVKNHPWVGGNKRTATALMRVFLRRNGFRLISTTENNIELSLTVEADQWKTDEIEFWLRRYTALIA
ncbi:MAG TPA: type II toxin-antitoxin system death-on-curing family toxin [Blastocatellia bacterium]|nr:type II toxin-antitoxin system death-on-curing family toxin [Blastocatellia bacterium]HMV81864.1 type II toxin-antitoxin system death-on-curing family toxin [Blastocatellia bacterium]HMX29135.1 type II toxin-antitoxin system death-on-curing family toxin [Blastocatellia bacterium]HMZ19259.1 type II toxin-antitoxin system death-on-curing family toxin [Blastocatellia bacterium]